MLHTSIPDRPPYAGALRRFRLLVGALVLVDVVLVALQYTSHALLPARKTDALWGMLVGLVVFGLLVDRRWAARARSERQG